MFKTGIITLILGLTLIAACGTIKNGRTQMVRFESTPSGAVVEIDGERIGTTPMVYELNRKKTYHVVLEVAGYEPHVVIMTKQLSGWALGNAVVLFVPGIVVDAYTGGLYKLDPGDIDVELRRKGLDPDDYDQNTFYFDVVLEAKENWTQIGRLTKKRE